MSEPNTEDAVAQTTDEPISPTVETAATDVQAVDPVEVVPPAEEEVAPGTVQEDSDEALEEAENLKYNVLDGAPVLVREYPGEANVFRGALDLGSVGKEVKILGKLVLSEAGLTLPSGTTFAGLGTKNVGDVPYQSSEDGAFSAASPSAAGEYLTSQLDEATGALVPAWKAFDSSVHIPAVRVAKHLYLRKAAEQAIAKELRDPITGWAAADGVFHDSFGTFDAETGTLVVPEDVVEPLPHKIRFQATLQNKSSTGASSVAILVNGSSISEATFRSGASVVYPYSASVEAFPLLKAGDKVQVALWHNSNDLVLVIGDVTTTLSISQS